MKLSVFLLGSITAFHLCVSYQPITTPSVFWCGNANLSSVYGISEFCSDYNKMVYGKPIKITLLYESLCGGCMQYITTTLFPEIFEKGKGFIEFELVPYGNARRIRLQNGTDQIECQHGPLECSLNKLHACSMKYLVDVESWFPFIYCFEKCLMDHEEEPEQFVDECYKSCLVDKTKEATITRCWKGPEGDELQSRMADRTEGIRPEKHTYVPWLVMNNVSTMQMQLYFGLEGIFYLLCGWYKGSTTPKNCPNTAYKRGYSLIDRGAKKAPWS